MVISKLAFSNFRVHHVRAALTAAAIALSVSLVVAVTAGYASLEAAAHRFLSQFMGTTDALISRRNDSRGGVPETLVDELMRDPDVTLAIGRLEMESGLITRHGQPIQGRLAQVIGIRRPQDTHVESLRINEGRWFDVATGNGAVVDQVAAEFLDVKLGDTFALPGMDRKLELKVVGIIQKPEILARQFQTIYVPLETLQEFAALSPSPRPGERAGERGVQEGSVAESPSPQPSPRDGEREQEGITRIMVDLQTGADADAFLHRWERRLAAIDGALKLRLTRDNRAEFDRNMQGMRILSYLGGTVSMLAATFIVFSTLSMGVAERTRTLAMLRAIGTQRIQLAGLVTLEGLILAGAGILVGVPLGILWIYLLSIVPKFAKFFTAGVVLSPGGMLFASLGSLAAAMVASLLPAYVAMRVSPLEAMAPLARPPSRRVPVICGFIGLLLVLIDSALLFGPWSREVKFYGHFALGIPGIMIGFFLLAPLFVWIVERVLGPIVAAMLGLRFALLRQQLTGGIWRAAGTCAALMVGLSILVVMQTQGNTMIGGWKLPDKFPDIFLVSFKFGGLTQPEQQKLSTVPGIRNGEIMPIAIAAPELGSGFLAIAGAAIMPDATMFFGIDPDRALKMLELDFRQGNAEEAGRMLKLGRHVIVTEEFQKLKGLKIGDKLPLKTVRHGTVDYTVAGVVWSPGIDVIVSMFDMGRQFDQRTAASLFGTLADAKEDFGVEGIYLFAANLEGDMEREQILANIKRHVGGWGMKAGDVREIKFMIQRSFGRLLLMMSTVAFAALAVASLGVTNTVMAGIRSRRWQFGVLRSIGVTRGQLMRLVLAEAVLLGLVACALGLIAGLLMSVNANKMAGETLGYAPPISVPWGIVVIGTCVVMAIALLASIIPAIHVARTEPLALLQAGRASV